MHHHINHCFCTDADHSNEFYDAGNIVEINKNEGDEGDWDSLIESTKVVAREDLSIAESMREKYPDYQPIARDCPTLKAEIVQWLNDNIKPKDDEQGWAMGSEQYRVIEWSRLSLFFQRRNDAKKFIRTFSKYKKATSYFDYFKDPVVNLVLDTETNKYKDRHENA